MSSTPETSDAPITSTPDDAVLRVRDLHAYIGQSHILQGVSFSVKPARVTTLLGRNGVGKTSTLRAILGLIEHDGDITLDGVGFAGRPTYERARMGIAYVPEDRDVWHGLTVAENLRLVERRGTEPNYDRIYELFPELAARRSQRAGTMSGGQQQMLSLARSLINDSSLMLIDEPTKGLAPRLVSEFAASLERIISSTSVLLVEQNLAVARRLADHVVVLAEGRVVEEGEAGAVLADEASLRRHLGVSANHVED